jgi:hypothetical protein
VSGKYLVIFLGAMIYQLVREKVYFKSELEVMR